MENKSEGFF